MIQKISQSTIKYPNFKQTNNKNDYCLIGKKSAMSINSDLDYQRKTVEQNERKIAILGITGLTLLFGTFLWNMKTLIELSKNKSRHMPANLRPFESLKNNSKIPNLENCKSVNKDLKTVLQRQVNQLKAGADVLAETGEPQASNRLLLYGTPGTGKSFFSKIFAKSIDAEYMEVMYSDFNSMWAGEGVDNLKKVFEGILKTAKKNPNQKYVVTFNEIDSVVQPVEKYTASTKGTYFITKLEERSVFLNYLELLKEKTPNVTVIGTTNISPKNNGLDGAAMSRFQNLIEVPFPDKDCLYEALKMNLDKIKNKDKFITDNDAKLKDLAQKMADRKFSFRNLEYIINDAKGYHLDDKMNGKNGDFKFEYLKQAEEKLKVSDGELNLEK